MILFVLIISCKKVSSECRQSNLDAMVEKKGLLEMQYNDKKKALENDKNYYTQRKLETYPDPEYKNYNDSANMVQKEIEALKTDWKNEDNKIASEINNLLLNCEKLK